MAASEFKRRMNRLKHELKNALRPTATRSARSNDSVRASNLNIARRTNIVAAHNLVRDGGVESAAAKQTARIRQTRVRASEAPEGTTPGAW